MPHPEALQLYIAGPMTRIPYFNFPAFHAAADELRSLEYWVISPHEQDALEVEYVAWASPTGDPADLDHLVEHGFVGAHPLTTASSNLNDIYQCDGVALLDGWEDSLGARFEIAAAERFGIPVWPIQHWIDEGACPPEANEADVSMLEDGGVTADDIIAMTEDEYTEHCDALWASAEDEVDSDLDDLSAFTDSLLGKAHAIVDRFKQECRMVSDTGGEKGAKLACFSQIPAGPLMELAEHYGRGAQKYDAHNFRKGYDWSLTIDALNRHLWAFIGGEDYDPETGSKHVTAVAWHALALSSFMDEHPSYDDRFVPTAAYPSQDV